MKNKCKTCGATCDEEKCWKHKKRSPLPKISTKKLVERIAKSIKDGEEYREKNKEQYSKMYAFFLSIWNKRPHYSEISNEYLGNECLSTFMHHILPKNKFPEAALDEDCVILVTFEEHQKAEQDIYFYEEINKRRIVLLRKYRPI